MKCWIGNYDGRREAMVIARNQKTAARVAETGLHTFRQFYMLQKAVPTGYKAETLYTRPMWGSGYLNDEWEEGRCLLIQARENP